MSGCGGGSYMDLSWGDFFGSIFTFDEISNMFNSVKSTIGTKRSQLNSIGMKA